MTSKLKWIKSHWRVNLWGLLHTLLHFVLFCQVIAVRDVLSVWLKLPDDEFALLHSLSYRFVADYRCYNSRLSETRQDSRKRPSGAFTLTTLHDNKETRSHSHILQSFHFHQVVCVTAVWSHVFHEKFVYTDQYMRYAGIQRFQWILFHFFYFQIWSLEGQARKMYWKFSARTLSINFTDICINPKTQRNEVQSSKYR